MDKNGKLKYCSARDADCAVAEGVFVVNKYYYASAIVRHANPGYEVELRTTRDADAAQRVFDEPATKTDSMPFPLVSAGGVHVGSKLNGVVDLLSISYKAGGGVELDEFDAVELAKFRDEIVPETQPGLQFYCMFDLKRGAHAYDNIRLLRANMLDAGARFVDSAIALRRAALNSETFVPFELPSTTTTRTYDLDFGGKRYESGSLVFTFKGDISQSCTLKCKINDVEALTGLEPVVGTGAIKCKPTLERYHIISLTWRRNHHRSVEQVCVGRACERQQRAKVERIAAVVQDNDRRLDDYAGSAGRRCRRRF
jgi:hypothetical protein